jgi:hypothetical protein
MRVKVALATPLIATWSWHLAYVVAGRRGNELWMEATSGDTSFTGLPLFVWLAGIIALIVGFIVATMASSERDRMGMYLSGVLTLTVVALVACDFGAFAFANMNSSGDGFPADVLVILLLVIGILLTFAPISWMWWRTANPANPRPAAQVDAARGLVWDVFLTVVVLQAIFLLFGFVVTGVARPEDSGVGGMLLLFAVYPGLAFLASLVGLDMLRHGRLKTSAAWAVLALPVIDVLLVVFR